MRRQRTTLQDIADRVGVTKMTVSRYLNNPNNVAKNTQKKIAEVIDELGFIPNRVPAMLSKASSKAIGVLISSFSNMVFADLINGIKSVAKKSGYSVLIMHTGYSAESEEEQINALLSYQVDAIILTEEIHSEISVKRLKLAKIPIVEVMGYVENPINMTVGVDTFNTAYAVTRGLIEAGRKNIAYFGVRLDYRTLQRQRGYEKAMHESGLKGLSLEIQEHSNFSLGSSLMMKTYEKNPNLDAVFCTNDDVAVGALFACLKLKLSIPKDISIVGYNGLNIGTVTEPKLCSISTPRFNMGALATRMIIEKLTAKFTGMQHIKVPVQITEGNSLTKHEYNCIKECLEKYAS
ncbi:LacI family DNA-binding transcriptional regulator [Succinatimonas hippei]|uniref:LacI family DNA-binding transcriptional regulator n=1 Tax=Succinatimonas hippei TaxID=626938 RepID=UPI0025A41FDE|nr:LacI family DNA-binding transcriptional regulator [Succinatimonas hippei]MDM8120908.1 LacI family DNA-binding transcriptional regulator [Succinatimonas hippei]